VRFLHYGKDGGKESTVWGFFLVEIKSLFSIVLLRFENGSREAYHDHAFNAISWVLKGQLKEQRIYKKGNAVGIAETAQFYNPSVRPIYTARNHFHMVLSNGTTWVFSIRGPWSKTWHEYLPNEGKHVTFTHGRKEAA
jgi:hypothetical protein